jgi:AcrR family transcriptional regulator
VLDVSYTIVSNVCFVPAHANKAIRDRILDSAEALFAQAGFDGATLRQITKVAQVNLAAVNYHFGDKETLFAEVLTRRLRPINEARLAGLQEAERVAGGAPVPLAVIIELLVRPLFILGPEPSGGGPATLRIIGRCLTEPQPFMTDLLTREFHPVLARFGQAIRRHVPALTPEDFLWRLNFMVGALHHTLATMHSINELTRGICRRDDHLGTQHRFIQFAVGTFTIPAVKVKNK